MGNEYKRFLWVSMMVTGTCAVGGLALSLNNINSVITIILIPTILFIPVAIIVIKNKLYVEGNYNNKSTLLIIATFIIGVALAPKLGSNIKGCIAVFGFEISTLLYFLVRRADKMSR